MHEWLRSCSTDIKKNNVNSVMCVVNNGAAINASTVVAYVSETVHSIHIVQNRVHVQINRDLRFIYRSPVYRDYRSSRDSYCF